MDKISCTPMLRWQESSARTGGLAGRTPSPVGLFRCKQIAPRVQVIGTWRTGGGYSAATGTGVAVP